jgi:dihydroorotase-like cyclic amidohydrolase
VWRLDLKRAALRGLTPARVAGLRGKGAIAVGADADLALHNLLDNAVKYSQC